MLFKSLIGVDYLGNSYYERTIGLDSMHRKKRFVKYVGKDFTAIPPEWDAWLRHTANNAPTTTMVSDVYCGNVSGSPYVQYPQGDVARKNRKIYSNYRRWIPQ